MPSILAFSLVLCYYGGKIMIKQLLLSLSRGGVEFFKSKVQNGALFKQNLISSVYFTLNKCLIDEYERVKNRNQKGPFLWHHNYLKDMVLSCHTRDSSLETLAEILIGHYQAHNRQVFTLKSLAIERQPDPRD